MTDLRLEISRIHSGKRRTPAMLILLLALWPISLLYRLGVSLRNTCYIYGLFEVHKLNCPVISIGNVTTGGTGKTPVTILIAERLQKRFITAVLSRGYRSGNEDHPVIFRGSQISESEFASVGDEITLMASKLPRVWFGVGANRLATGSELVSREKIQVALLDDGFQHRRISRQCDIVLIDATNPFGNSMSLPAGPMREALSAIRRCQIVLITRCESVDQSTIDDLIKKVSRFVDEIQIFRAYTVIESIKTLGGASELKIADRRVWLFSGIGNPGAFENSLAATGARICGHTIFPDHHPYTEHDIESLNVILNENRAELLLTTAKDAVKLAAYNLDKSRYGVVEIGIDFVDRADIFWDIIARSVGAEI